MSTVHLSAGRVNLLTLRDSIRRRLTDYLILMDGSKTVLWDKSLMGPFNTLIDTNFLKTLEVTRQVEFAYNRLPEKQIDTNHAIFIVRGKLSIIRAVADAVREEVCINRKVSDRKYHILLVPRGSLICEKRLQDAGVLANFDTVTDFPVIYPLDSDLLSLEESTAFYDLTIEKDTGILFDVAAAIAMMQSCYGTLPSPTGIGKAAQTVADIVKRMQSDSDPADGMNQNSRISSVILFDRSADLITPLLTQHTYEGLIDENIGISQATVKMPREKFPMAENPAGDSASKTISLSLNSAEDLFIKLRDKHFEAVGLHLKETSKQLSSVKMETNQVKSVKELKQIVAKVPYFLAAKASVSNHLVIGQEIKDKIMNQEYFDVIGLESELLNFTESDREIELIETKLYKCEDIRSVVRLICLQAQTTGLKRSAFDFYRKELIQSYGYSQLLTLMSLEKSQLLRPPSTSNYIPISSFRTYSSLNKLLGLWDGTAMQKLSDQAPNIHHVYNGYAPLSVKLIDRLRQFGPAALNESLKSHLGVSGAEERICFGETNRSSQTFGLSSRTSDETKVVLVVFIGGCTFAEISALRLISQQEEQNVEFLVLTTNIINPNLFIKQFIK